MHSGPDGTIEITIPMNSNDIVLVNLNRSREENERSNSR